MSDLHKKTIKTRDKLNKSEEPTFIETEVSCTYLGVKDQLKLFKYLTAHVGGGAKGIENMRDNDIDEHMLIMGAKAVGSFADALKDIEDDEMIFWIEKLLEKVKVGGKNYAMESEAYYGKMGFLFEVIYFALEVNYGDFLQEKLGAIVEALTDIMKVKLSESQTAEM